MLRNKPTIYLLVSLSAVAVLLLFSGCSGSDNPASSGSNTTDPPPDQGTDPPPDPQATIVVIASSTFSPSTLTIKVGTTVTWRNDDALTHTVTSDSGEELSSSLMSNGDTYSHTFNTAGTFPYHCSVHPFMTATVIVEP